MAKPRQQAGIYTLPLNSLPQRLLLRRGTRLVIQGEPLKERNSTVALRIGNTDVSNDRTADRERWTVQWETQRELSSLFTIRVMQLVPGRPEAVLKRLTVELYDTPPFRITRPVVGEKVGSKSIIAVERTGSVQASGVELRVDEGEPILLPLKGGSAPLSLPNVLPGSHNLRIRVLMEDGLGAESFAPLPVEVVPAIRIAPLPAGAVFDLRDPAKRSPAPIPITIEVDEPAITKVTLYLNGKEWRRSTTPFKDIALDIAQMPAGEGTLTVAGAAEDGRTYPGGAVRFQVLRDGKGELRTIADALRSSTDKLLAALNGYDATLAGVYRAGKASPRLPDLAAAISQQCAVAADALEKVAVTPGVLEPQRANLPGDVAQLAAELRKLISAWQEESKAWRSLNETNIEPELVLARYTGMRGGGVTAPQRSATFRQNRDDTIRRLDDALRALAP